MLFEDFCQFDKKPREKTNKHTRWGALQIWEQICIAGKEWQ